MDRIIVAENDAGLANRIKTVVSCLRYQDEYNHKLWVNWKIIGNEDKATHKDGIHNFNCRFRSLFKNEIDTIDDDFYKTKRNEKKVIAYRTHHLMVFDIDNIPKNFDEYKSKSAKYLRKRTDGRHIDFNYNRIPKECKNRWINYFKKLEVNDDLQEKIDNFSQKNFDENTVSVHIRSWTQRCESDRFLKLFKQNGLKDFENAMLKKLEENNKTNFFLSTDRNTIKEHFMTKIPELQNKIKIYPRCSSHGTSRSMEKGIQEDLIDLYLLSKNKSIIGSHNSTFTEVAWWLAECPKDINIIYSGSK